MKRLTRRQQEVLSFIDEWIQQKRYPPSVREIATRFGLKSASGVHKHVKALVRKGYISKADYLSRSIRILDPSSEANGSSADTLLVPILGVLMAGGTIARPAVPLLPLTLAARAVPEPREAYALRIGGQHLRQEGLLDGDCAVVMPHGAVRNGLVVVASVRAQDTVIRRFLRDGDTVHLEPLAPDLSPLVLPAREVHVQGVVAGVWRPFQ